MAFFKESRAQMKAEALMSQLEYANKLFDPKDMFRAKFHLRAAQKALTGLRKIHGEYVLSAKGWEYVAQLGFTLKTSSEVHGFGEVALDCNHIAEYAVLMMNQSKVA